MERAKTYAPALILAVLAGAVGIIWYAVYLREAPRHHVRVDFFDVGQGDGILIETPTGNQILIDGGPDRTILQKLGARMPFWDRTIELAILTHPHADHVSGLLEVLGRYTVETVLESGERYPTAEYGEWHRLLKTKGVKTIIARRGEEIDAGGGLLLEVLFPLEDISDRSFKNPHDGNVVVRLRYASSTLLFMGDAERPIEDLLIAMEGASGILADILKIGHHGSKTSSSEEFLEAVRPSAAVISVGRKNRYGHPYREVIDRLQALGIPIFRTDEQGDIVFESDGMSFHVVAP